MTEEAIAAALRLTVTLHLLYLRRVLSGDMVLVRLEALASTAWAAHTLLEWEEERYRMDSSPHALVMKELEAIRADLAEG